MRALRIMTISAVVIGAAMASTYSAGIRWNTSPSMPMGLWTVGASPKAVRRGDVVTLCLSADALALGLARGYLTGGECPGNAELLVKTVAAIPGDEVAVTDAGVSVNGALIPHSRSLPTDDLGRQMRAVDQGVYRVSDHQVWVIGTADDRSYDSRYWGPVPVSSLRGIARPLFTQGERHG